MLVKCFYFLFSLLITVSCSSSSDDGGEVNTSFSQAGQALIEKALNTPRIFSQLTTSSHAILSFIAIKNEYALSFYDFAVHRYDFNYFGFDSEDPQSWNAFINTPLRDFSHQEADQAQDIINKIVLPSHPFLSQVPFTFQTAEFLNQMIPDIDTYLDKVAKDIFIQQFSQILALEDPSEAQILLKDLIHKAKDTSFPDPEFKYHHAFLANVPFDYFKKINYCHPEHHNSINSFIYQLAPILYSEIAEDSKQMADKILAGLLPSIYSTLTDTSYENTIRKYQESLLQPIDKSYLWAPQQFHSDLLKALQDLSVIEDPNFLPHQKMLKFLSDDSQLVHLFRHYIAQNYFKPSYLSPQDQPLFWSSLFYSSFTDFSSNFPNHQHEILQQLQLLPLLNEVQSLFVYELLDDQFRLLSSWGHTSTIKRIFHYRADIPADYVTLDHQNAAGDGRTANFKILLHDIAAYYAGWALRDAADGGHTAIVELLLLHRTDISAIDVGMALLDAARCGHACIIDFILHCRTDISADNVGWAFFSAADGGHTAIAELLLQSHKEFSTDCICRALCNAAEKGKTAIVELILQRCTDIPSDGVSSALRNSAKGGHTAIVELLLKYHIDIPDNRVGQALECATDGGHSSIVNLLLQNRTDISDDYAGGALQNSARDGNTAIVKLLLQQRTYIPAEYVGLALHYAAWDGHAAIVELLLQYRTDIPAEYVGLALQNSAWDEHATIVKIILQRRTDIPAEYVGRALRYSAKSGNIYIVKLILQNRKDIPAYYVSRALLCASEKGHTPIVELILQHRNDIYVDIFDINSENGESESENDDDANDNEYMTQKTPRN
jgi:ankyrin repeat protein